MCAASVCQSRISVRNLTRSGYVVLSFSVIESHTKCLTDPLYIHMYYIGTWRVYYINTVIGKDIIKWQVNNVLCITTNFT